MPQEKMCFLVPIALIAAVLLLAVFSGTYAAAASNQSRPTPPHTPPLHTPPHTNLNKTAATNNTNIQSSNPEKVFTILGNTIKSVSSGFGNSIKLFIAQYVKPMFIIKGTAASNAWAWAAGTKAGTAKEADNSNNIKNTDYSVELFVDGVRKQNLTLDDINPLKSVEFIDETMHKNHTGPLLIDVLKKAGINDGAKITVSNKQNKSYKISWAEAEDRENKIAVIYTKNGKTRLSAAKTDLKLTKNWVQEVTRIEVFTK